MVALTLLTMVLPPVPPSSGPVFVKLRIRLPVTFSTMVPFARFLIL